MCADVQFGVIVLTTSAGIMDHEEARRKKVGGKVRLLWHQHCAVVSPACLCCLGFYSSWMQIAFCCRVCLRLCTPSLCFSIAALAASMALFAYHAAGGCDMGQ